MFGLAKSPITANVVQNVSKQQIANKSLVATVIAAFNKIYHGSETPVVYRDHILETVEEKGRYRAVKTFAKGYYLREVARERVLRNNVHVRKLEKKISGGAYGMKSMENRF